MPDIEAIADALVSGAKRHLDDALAALTARIAALEAREPPGFAGALRNQEGHLIVSLSNGSLFDAGPIAGKRGPPVDASAVEAVVRAVVAAHMAEAPAPVPVAIDIAEIRTAIMPGLDASIREAVAGHFAALPPAQSGRDGKDGAPGLDGKDGAAGKDGIDGKDGAPGLDGKDGAAGKDGIDGKDGAPGRDGVDGKDGADGTDGQPGLPGKDGLDGKDGNPGLPGRDGADGKDGDAGAPGKDGEAGEPGKDGGDGKDGAPGNDGKDGEPGLPGKDGKDGVPGNDGKDGLDGKDGADGHDGVDGQNGTPGADGKGVAAAVIDRDHQLVLTFSDGSMTRLGVVVGRDCDPADVAATIAAEVAKFPRPRDGVDGLGFDDLSVIYDGERAFTFRFVRGEQVREFQVSVPFPLYRGVWRAGLYKQGDSVSYAGSQFVARCDTEATPETSADWQMNVKRGRDGKETVKWLPATAKLPRAPEGDPK